ncbi:unnamed protein product [Arabis nemorensis]|uniref:F-box domain-containing protein n=1 Tax=Arabis nemorensis TaxID=586526 RepID=A0A565BSG3_9BRAS|nr:unnamed protein product [Arabis nemorensis]
MRKMMDSFPDDLWAIILVLLPLKTITASKLVCKQWKSIVESSFFRELFISHHENSHSSPWSLMCKNDPVEVLSHYGGEIWGLGRSLNSYIYSFLTKKFVNHQEIYKHAKVVAYTDVGLVLIRVVSLFGNVSYFVANPVSEECVETDPPWFEPMHYFWPLGIATRTEKNGVLSGFKVVLLFDAMAVPWKKSLKFLVYSSETGLWSLETVQVPVFFWRHDYHNPISSNGSLHWLARNHNNDEAVVSIDFYSAGTGSVLVTPFPDLGKSPKFNRACTTCQGFLVYMNVVSVTKDDGSVDDRFSVWKLKSRKWQLVSEIVRENGFNYIPFAINPIDGKSVYFWSTYGNCLLSMNLLNGEFVCLNKFERGCISSSIECAKVMACIRGPIFSSFVLPLWVHRIPNKLREV